MKRLDRAITLQDVRLKSFNTEFWPYRNSSLPIHSSTEKCYCSRTTCNRSEIQNAVCTVRKSVKASSIRTKNHPAIVDMINKYSPLKASMDYESADTNLSEDEINTSGWQLGWGGNIIFDHG